MKKITLGFLVSMIVFAFAGATQGAIVNLAADNLVTVDGTTYDLVSPKPTDPGPTLPAGTGLMWEWNADATTWKACICRMVAFRALQAAGQSVGITDFTSAITGILTGWNSDGPEELYVDNMPWVDGTNFAYAVSMTSNAELTLADAWYEYTIGDQTYRVESRAGNYAFNPDTGHAGYRVDWDFFDYRSAVKNGSGNADEKAYFKNVVRSQIVDNFKEETSFNVNPVPIPSAL